MDIDRLMRLRGVVNATAQAEAEQSIVDAYSRIRTEVADAVGDQHADEIARLFPAELTTAGKVWGAQAQEVKSRMAQIAGWLDGMIDSALVERRIEAEAEAKARQTGFR